MTLDWDYDKRILDVSMPGYAPARLQSFRHNKPKQLTHGPTRFTPPKYGQKIQIEDIDESEPMTEEEKKILEQICGVFLYYARAVDPTMMHALNVLAAQQSKGTK